MSALSKVATSVAALSLTAFAAPIVGSVPADAAASQSCVVTSYLYSIRNVTHTAPKWVAYRVNFQTFAAGSDYHSKQVLQNKRSSNVQTSASTTSSVSGSASENDIITKVEVKAKIGSSFRRTSGSTASESTTVVDSQAHHFKHNTVFIIFKARRVVHGTFQISTCNLNKGSQTVGHVVWHNEKWSAYTASSQKNTWAGCAESANNPAYVTDAQKKAGCP